MSPTPEKPRFGRAEVAPARAHGLPLGVYSLGGGVLAVGVANAVISWAGQGNALDWLALLMFGVLVIGVCAEPVLRRLSLRR